MTLNKLRQDAVLRVGEVSAVQGRTVTVKVDKNKNLSGLFLNGEILRNVSVNSYIEIRKGFMSIIGKVDGERIEEEPIQVEKYKQDKVDRNRRYLSVSLIGYIDSSGAFTAGMKELPLIGNEAYIVTKKIVDLIHNLVTGSKLKINIAETDEGFPIDFPVDSLFNGHIAIFGNTGSGKSNTLAALYESLVYELKNRSKESVFENRVKFVLFDFNGEYTREDCITKNKTVYNLSTRQESENKIPFSEDDLLDLEILSILSDATEKTQKPFLKRTLDYYNKYIRNANNPELYLRKILQDKIEKILTMKSNEIITTLAGYMSFLLQKDNEDDLLDDLKWIPNSKQYVPAASSGKYFNNKEDTHDTLLFQSVQNFVLPDEVLEKFIITMYIKIIIEIINHKVQNDYVFPVIQRLDSRKSYIKNLISTDSNSNPILSKNNFAVVDLNKVNLAMKKTLPLLLCKKIYNDHKNERDRTGEDRILCIIIDEAHNILSHTSSRESESWKDYRLETFEEIIKEGRKFGVFVTISSQRPSDISQTITSQAHNYFIHRLINQHDLKMISSAVSYIDRMTEESIPTLPTGTCIFSGIASQRPIKVHINELEPGKKPESETLTFSGILEKQEKNDEVNNADDNGYTSPPDDLDHIEF